MNLKRLMSDLEPASKPVQGRMARIKKPKAQALYSDQDVIDRFSPDVVDISSTKNVLQELWSQKL